MAGQVGLDMAINDRWFVNASAWLIDIDTDVHTAVGTINTSIDPVAFMFGVGYRF
jgi:outer membrane protein